MPDLPTGTVTFLFTDIEGSTKLAQEYPDQWEPLRQRHNSILQAAIAAHNGTIFQDVGDAFCAAFHTAPEALAAALEAQRGLFREDWHPVPIKVRIGIHTGSARLSDDGLHIGYTGYTTLALTNRIMSAGHGGQTLLSGATRELVRDVLPENVELLDLGEKRLKDLLRAERLSQLNAPGLPASFPPLKTLDAFPNNLPMQLTTFIGRAQEITEIKGELDVHRLVTLTGSGGTGKTRLSLQVAAELLEAFEQGVWFVELAPLADPQLIPQTILSAIGINEQAGRQALDLLKDYLVDKQTLIVLDNCEHLIEASSKLVNVLLNSAPGLKILASSREALGVKGELSYRVPSLSLPDLKHVPAIDQLSQYEAVRLFIDRAQLVATHFTVDKDNAPFIAQVCYRLDGIPLAIELAAARIKMLSVEQISARLDDRFRLLTGGARTALPRQQTLRALIDWSYDILTGSERLLMCRLSIFVGGWTLDAAEEVCAGEGIETNEIMDLLGQLVNKSLVNVIECSDCGEMRYRMLETIRQYAREKLLEAGASENQHRRHMEYFVKLAEQAGPELFHSDQVRWLNRLEDDLDNLRMALEWAQASDVPAGLQLLVASHLFWELRGNPRELADWLANLLDRYQKEDSLRARALQIYSWQLGLQGDYTGGRPALDQSLQLSRTISDKEAEADCLLSMGVLIATIDDIAIGIPFVEQSLAIYQALGDKLGQSNASGWLSLNHNDLDYSKAMLAESLRLCRELGHLSGIAVWLAEMALRTIWGGEFSQPAVMLEEARRINHELGNQPGEIQTLYIFGVLAYWQGDYDRARAYLEESNALAEKAVNFAFVPWASNFKAYAFLRQGDFLKAREMFRLCFTQCRKSSSAVCLAFTIEGLASMYLNQGQAPRSLRLFAWADGLRLKINNRRPPIEQAAVDGDLARLHSELNEAAYTALYAEGQALSEDQAIAMALED